MKAITIHALYAGLIMLGAKEHETRTWATNYRGQIAIHVAKTMTATEKKLTDKLVYRQGIGTRLLDFQQLGVSSAFVNW